MKMSENLLVINFNILMIVDFVCCFVDCCAPSKICSRHLEMSCAAKFVKKKNKFKFHD